MAFRTSHLHRGVQHTRPGDGRSAIRGRRKSCSVAIACMAPLHEVILRGKATVGARRLQVHGKAAMVDARFATTLKAGGDLVEETEKRLHRQSSEAKKVRQRGRLMPDFCCFSKN